jgi:hypothetical protein
MAKRIALSAALVLAISGAAAVSSSVPASAASPYAEIPSAYGSHHCLDAENDSHGNPSQNGDRVQVFTCLGGKNQEWNEVLVSSQGPDTNYFKIVNEASGKCLDAENDRYDNPDNNGDKVQLFTCNGGSNQLWQLSDTIYGNVWINKYASDHGFYKVLDAYTANGWNPNINGDPVQVYDGTSYNGSLRLNQFWLG